MQCIQTELKAPKGRTNKFGGYSYRSAEDILEALKPLLSKYDCFLTINDEIVEVGGRVYVKSTATPPPMHASMRSTDFFALTTPRTPMQQTLTGRVNLPTKRKHKPWMG